MKTLLKPVVAAGLIIAGAVPAVVLAQAAPVTAGIGVANLDAIRANSNAFKTAQSQRPTTYKAQYDQANTRAQAIQAQLKPLADKFEKDRAANVNAATLQTQLTQIQTLQQSGQQEINRILAPVALSEAYVDEQIGDKLEQAIKQASSKRKVSLIVSPEAVIYAEAGYNMNQAILAEINTLLPSAQLVPPAGWEPRQVREQRAAAAAQTAGRPAAAPVTPAPKPTEGR